LYLKKGLTSRALSLLQDAHARAPQLADAQLHLALAYRAAGRSDEAEKLLAALRTRGALSPELRAELDAARSSRAGAGRRPRRCAGRVLAARAPERAARAHRRGAASEPGADRRRHAARRPHHALQLRAGHHARAGALGRTRRGLRPGAGAVVVDQDL